MTPFAKGTLLRGAMRAPSVDVDALVGRGVLVLAPHPDDETLGCGAALATLASRGYDTHVVVVTDGGASHPGSARWPRARLAEHRARELAAAVAVLGGGRITHECLGFADQGIPADSDPAVLDALERLAATMVCHHLDTVWTTWEGDPHPDHVRTATLADSLADTLRYVSGIRPPVFRFPVWGRFADAPTLKSGDELLRFTPTTASRVRKACALACHVSQMTPMIDDDPDGFVMPEAMQRHFLEFDELFVRRHVA